MYIFIVNVMNKSLGKKPQQGEQYDP